MEDEQSDSGQPISATGIGTRTLLAGALVGIGGALLAAALGVARTKVLAVELDPGGLGLYGQLFALLSALSAVTGLGLGLGTTKVVAAAKARDDRRMLQTALGVSTGLPLIIGLAIAVVIAATAALIAPVLLDSDKPGLILLAAIAIPMIAVQGPLIHGLQGLKDVPGVQASTVGFGLVLTATTAIGAILSGLDGAIAALVISQAAFLLFLGLRLRRMVSPLGVVVDPREGLKLKWLREPAIRDMLAIGVASLIVGLTAAAADITARTILLHSEGEAQAGIFQSLKLISVQAVGVVTTAIVFFSFASFSESAALHDRARTRGQTDDALRLALLLTFPIILTIGLFRDELVPIFLSPEFAETADKLPLSLTGDALRTVAWVLGAVLVPVGLTRAFVGISVSSMAVFMVLVVALVPSLGLDGVLIANIALWTSSAILATAVLRYTKHYVLTLRAAATIALCGALLAFAFSVSMGIGVSIATLFAGSIALLFVATTPLEREALWARAAERLGRRR